MFLYLKIKKFASFDKPAKRVYSHAKLDKKYAMLYYLVTVEKKWDYLISMNIF